MGGAHLPVLALSAACWRSLLRRGHPLSSACFANSCGVRVHAVQEEAALKKLKEAAAGKGGFAKAKVGKK